MDWCWTKPIIFCTKERRMAATDKLHTKVFASSYKTDYESHALLVYVVFENMTLGSVCVSVCVCVCWGVDVLHPSLDCGFASWSLRKGQRILFCVCVWYSWSRDMGSNWYIYLAVVMRTRDASYMFSLPPDATHTSPCKECLSVFSVRYLKPLSFQEFALFSS